MSILSFHLIVMSSLTWITEKELEREIKNKGDWFLGRVTWQFYSGGEKMRSATGHQGENEWQWKKSEQEHIQHFLHKTCN